MPQCRCTRGSGVETLQEQRDVGAPRSRKDRRAQCPERRADAPLLFMRQLCASSHCGTIQALQRPDDKAMPSVRSLLLKSSPSTTRFCMP